MRVLSFEQRLRREIEVGSERSGSGRPVASERRKVGLKADDLQLVEALWSLDVLEQVLAKLPQSRAVEIRILED